MEHMYIQTQMYLCVATNIPIIIIAKSPTIALIIIIEILAQCHPSIQSNNF